MPQRPLDRLLAPGREKQYLFTAFVQYIQRKKSLSDEKAARDWVARQLAFPVDRLHYKISFCNQRSRAEEQVDELDEGLPEGSAQQVEAWLSLGARPTLWKVNWDQELMWPDTHSASLEHFASPHLFMHIWYWKFGKEFRSSLKKQKRGELLGVLERHSPYTEEYRWQSPALSGGLLLGIITGKLPGAQAAKEGGAAGGGAGGGGVGEREKERDKEGERGLLQRVGLRRRSLSAGDLTDLAALDSENLSKPDLLRGASAKTRNSYHLIDHPHPLEAEDVPHPSSSSSGGGAHLSPKEREGGVARQRSSSQGGMMLHSHNHQQEGRLRLLGDEEKEKHEGGREEAEEGNASPHHGAANGVLWRGLVLSGRQGATYQLTNLAWPGAHDWPLLGAFAERVESDQGEALAWDAPRPKVYMRALMCRASGQERRLGRLKEAVEAFRKLPKTSAVVKVHDHMLVRGAGQGGREMEAAYCVVMDRLESSLGGLLQQGAVSLSLRCVKSMAIETARALKAWHNLGRAHGAVRLHNLFVSQRPGQEGEPPGGQGHSWRAEVGCLDLLTAYGEEREREGSETNTNTNTNTNGEEKRGLIGAQQARDVFEWGHCWLEVLLAGGGEGRREEICQGPDVATRERAIFHVIGRQAGSLVAAIARAISPDPGDRPSMQGVVGILTFRQRWSGDLPEVPDRVMDMHDGSLRKIKRAVLLELPKPLERGGEYPAAGGGPEAVGRVRSLSIGNREEGGVTFASPSLTYASATGGLVPPGNRSPVLQVCGMGGVGKSVLVQRALEDPEVWARYPDGIIWVSMRREGTDDERLQRKQLRLLRHLLGPEAFYDLHLGGEGDGPRLLSNPMLWSALCRDKLAAKACLVVVDGVWQPEHARAFDFLGPKALLLLTTRRDLVGSESRSKTLKLRELGEKMGPLATALLLTYARRGAREEEEDEAREEEEWLTDEGEGKAVQELEAVCDGLPLALALVGSLRRGSGMTWQEIRDKVMRAGGAAAAGEMREYARRKREGVGEGEGERGGGSGHGKYAGLHAVLSACVADLSPMEHALLRLYTVWRENTWVEEGLVSAVLEMGGEDTLALLKRLAARSLIRLEARSHRSSVHGLIRGFVRSGVSMEEQALLHVRTLSRGVKGTIVCGPDKVFDQVDAAEACELPYLRENFWYHMEQVPDRLDALTPLLFVRVHTLLLYRFWGLRWGLIKAMLRRCENLETFRAYREAQGGGKSSLWGHDMEGVFKNCAGSLRVLSFPSAKLAGRGNDSLLKGLRHCSRLETLDLPHLTMGEEGARALVDVVQTCARSLQCLNLRVSNAGSFGLEKALLSALRLCRSLTSLDLSHCGFDGSGAQVLVTVLADCPQLTVLRLDGNQLGGKLLGQALKIRSERCVSLRSLSLSCSGLEDGSMEGLRSLVSQCTLLEALDLSKNRMGPGAAKVLAACLQQWRGLRRLNLSYSCRADKECKALTWALSEALALGACPGLRSLDLRGLVLEDEEANALGQALHHCGELEGVLLSADGLSLTGAERLASSGLRHKQMGHHACLYLCVHDRISHEGTARRVERRLADLSVPVRRCKPEEPAESLAAPPSMR